MTANFQLGRAIICLSPKAFCIFAEHLSHVKRLGKDLQRLMCPLPILRKRAYKLKSCVSFCYISVRNHRSEFDIYHRVYFMPIHLSIGTHCFVYFEILYSDIGFSWNWLSCSFHIVLCDSRTHIFTMTLSSAVKEGPSLLLEFRLGTIARIRPSHIILFSIHKFSLYSSYISSSFLSG